MNQEEIIAGLEQQLFELKENQLQPILIICGKEINLHDENQRHDLFFKENISFKNYFKDKENTQFCDKFGRICIYALYTEYQEITSWCFVRLLKNIENAMDNLDDSDDDELGEIPFDQFNVTLTIWFLTKILNIQGGKPNDNLFKERFSASKLTPVYYLLSRNKTINPSLQFAPVKNYQQCYSYFIACAAQVSTAMDAYGLDFYAAYEVLFLNMRHYEQIKHTYPPRFMQAAEYCKQNPTYLLINLLQEYVQFTGIDESSYKQRFFRFIAGYWNQHHVNVVEDLLRVTYPNAGASCEELLEGLRGRLLIEGKTINPEGTLANIINFTQEKLGYQLIDISMLNKAIEMKIEVQFNFERSATI